MSDQPGTESLEGPTSQPIIAEQARLMELALERSKGQPVEVPFDADDVGGQLVAIVSSGLYSDPRDCIREYAQNAIDAGATRINIKLSGFNVEIEDDGSGMSMAALIQARKFGMSTKDPERDVGFRGIGVYAGFPICEAARIETQVRGSTIRYMLRFDFSWMRQTIDEQRKTGPVSLAFLMQHGTKMSFETTPPAQEGGTTVYLDHLSSAAYHDLSDWTALESYVVATLPVGYDDKFQYSDLIEKKLKTLIPRYRSVTVHLENVDSGDSGFLQRRFPNEPELTKPEFWNVTHKAPDGGDERVAVVWASWAKNRRIRHEAAGLLYKVKGFTIGDNQLARRLFKRPAIYDWFVGEIWVIDRNVMPNAARSDFEASRAKRALEDDLIQQVVKPLVGIAENISKTAVARERFQVAEQFVKDTRRDIKTLEVQQAEKARAAAYESLRAIERLKLDVAELSDLSKKRPTVITELNSVIHDLGLIIHHTPSTTDKEPKKSRRSKSRTDAYRAPTPISVMFETAGRSVSAMRDNFDLIDRALDLVGDERLRTEFQTALTSLLLKNKEDGH